MGKMVHLVMPFMREQNKRILLDAYRPMNVILHPIMFEDEQVHFDESWVLPCIIPMSKTQNFGTMEIQNVKRNYFIENCEIVDSDYYVAVDDDDMFEPNVFDSIKKIDDDIVIISMKRGHCIPKEVIPDRKYPTGTLFAGPDNVSVGSISNQQSFVKGSVFRKYLYDADGHCGDGRLAVRRKAEGEQIAYRPDLFALFNYYEPGRWTLTGKVSFGVLVNDTVRLDMCFRQSEIEGAALMIMNPKNATSGLNAMLWRMEIEGAEIGVLAHQDMHLRQGWIPQAREQIAKLPDSWIVAGIIGKDLEGNVCGKLHDMRIVPHFNTTEMHTFPHPAACFDECMIIVNLKKHFRFDEALEGFDLYGTMAVLQAWEMGGTAWILDAFAEHYCMRPFTWFPDKVFQARFKWLHERFPNAPRIDSTVLGVPEKKKQAA